MQASPRAQKETSSFLRKGREFMFGTSRSRSAFTLIELLLVVTIIVTIGFVSVSGFSRMLELQDSDTTMKSIKNTIDLLDRDILRYNSVSYDAVFSSGSVGFAGNLDAYQKNPLIPYSFDFSAGTGVLVSTGNTSTGILNINLVGRNGEWSNFTLGTDNQKQIFSSPFGASQRGFKILSLIDGNPMNGYFVQYYNITNTDNIPEQEVRLVKIEGTLGWTSKNYSSLLVSNTLGQKTLLWSWATLDTLEKATLTFEKNGKEMTLEMTPKK